MSNWMRARDLHIIWGDDDRYWTWTYLPPPDEKEEVAELDDVCWLEIKGCVELKKLLIKTSYSAYLVFKLREYRSGLNKATARVRIVGDGKEPEGEEECRVFIDREKIPGERGRFPQARGNGWMEMKLGEFFNDLGHHGRSVEATLLEVNNLNWKSGLIVKGIEFRPNYY